MTSKRIRHSSLLILLLSVCVYKEKIVKNDLYRKAQDLYKFKELHFYKISNIYEYNELSSTIVGYNIRMSSFKFNWIIYDLSGEMHLREFVWTLDVFKHFLLIDATEAKLVAIKIELNLISFHFFANTPFN